MNKGILLLIIAVFTVAVYAICYYLLGFDQKKTLIITGCAFLAMVVPEIISAVRNRQRA